MTAPVVISPQLSAESCGDYDAHDEKGRENTTAFLYYKLNYPPLLALASTLSCAGIRPVLRMYWHARLAQDSVLVPTQYTVTMSAGASPASGKSMTPPPPVAVDMHCANTALAAPARSALVRIPVSPKRWAPAHNDRSTNAALMAFYAGVAHRIHTRGWMLGGARPSQLATTPTGEPLFVIPSGSAHFPPPETLEAYIRGDTQLFLAMLERILGADTARECKESVREGCAITPAHIAAHISPRTTITTALLSGDVAPRAWTDPWGVWVFAHKPVDELRKIIRECTVAAPPGNTMQSLLVFATTMRLYAQYGKAPKAKDCLSIEQSADIARLVVDHRYRDSAKTPMRSDTMLQAGGCFDENLHPVNAILGKHINAGIFVLTPVDLIFHALASPQRDNINIDEIITHISAHIMDAECLVRVYSVGALQEKHAFSTSPLYADCDAYAQIRAALTPRPPTPTYECAGNPMAPVPAPTPMLTVEEAREMVRAYDNKQEGIVRALLASLRTATQPVDMKGIQVVWHAR